MAEENVLPILLMVDALQKMRGGAAMAGKTKKKCFFHKITLAFSCAPWYDK